MPSAAAALTEEEDWIYSSWQTGSQTGINRKEEEQTIIYREILLRSYLNVKATS
jgi:hypothetical protein